MVSDEVALKLINLAKAATHDNNTIRTFILLVDTLECWDEAIKELSENEYDEKKLNDYIYDLVVKYRED